MTTLASDLSAFDDALASAVLGARPWQDALHDAARVLNADAALFTSYEPRCVPRVATRNIGEGLRLFSEQGWTVHDVRSDVVERSRGGGVIVDGHIGTSRELARMPFYADFLPRLGLAWHAAIVFEQGGLRWGLSIQRASDRPAFDEADVARLDGLRPVLARATAAAAQVGFAETRGLLAGLAVNGCPAFVVDRRLRVVAGNEPAQGRGDAFLRVRGGCLRTARSGEQTALDRLVAEAVGDAPATQHGLTVLSDEAGHRVLVRAVAAPASIELMFAGGRAIVWLTPLDTVARPPAAAVGRLFGLTRAECALALELGAGATLAESAAILGITLSTARDRLKTVFAKTGAKRQAELVLLLQQLR